SPDQKVEFVWDGLDHLGNSVAGSIKADVNIGFVYDAVYYSAGDFAQAFAQAGTNVTGIRSRQEITSWKNDSIKIFQTGRGAGTIAEGWTLSAHHSWFQYSGNILYKGDGTTTNNNAAIIITVAGNGQGSFSGDDGPAVEAELFEPYGISVDSIGNIYIADSGNHRIRKVDANGIITTVAGNGQGVHSGDGGPATEATLRFPYDVVLDSIGNIYIADAANQRIRKVDTSGVITTVAGNGQQGYSGDGGPAVELKLNWPRDVAVDSLGNIYIADTYNQRIRKVNTSGIITTVAGNGQQGDSGDGGPAAEAMLYDPRGVVVDSIGNIYITDEFGNKIRKVGTSGVITTVAGNDAGFLGGYSGDGGPATEAGLFFPTRVAVGSTGDFYMAGRLSHRIRKVSFPEGFAGLITADETAFTDENGLGYIMDSTGLHKSTIDLSTGNTLLSFGYNVDLQLES
ncbi:MAG: hypothetical protein GY727_06365, partial [Gammaproteobacteria bacterium]|nr:hypothetical protein [Gammaproteobacteria bacterium]